MSQENTGGSTPLAAPRLRANVDHHPAVRDVEEALAYLRLGLLDSAARHLEEALSKLALPLRSTSVSLPAVPPSPKLNRPALLSQFATCGPSREAATQFSELPEPK